LARHEQWRWTEIAKKALILAQAGIIGRRYRRMLRDLALSGRRQGGPVPCTADGAHEGCVDWIVFAGQCIKRYLRGSGQSQPVGDAAQPVDCGIVGSRHHPDPRCGMAVTPFLDDAATILPVAPVAAGLAPA
jgi:hypothetical protein